MLPDQQPLSITGYEFLSAVIQHKECNSNNVYYALTYEKVAKGGSRLCMG